MSDDQDRQGSSSAGVPTGKRQRTGKITTSSYNAKRAPEPAEREEKHGGSVTTFLPEVSQEIRKVIWPTGREMVNYTLVVFGFLIVLTGLVFGVDFLAGMGVEAIFTP
ncbi:preprotein translocase subunit SecE [Corynebacterium caspium]|uniref:preprotein translocase subunit SecE n=1 Tax=Corynebacterium caspium TaxID=234828 RepID=UPI0003828C53|nr:preprotein translocase subunit SecE [Corynebacterium caspium]WKD59872.1 preprotein translocase subunit SecE [Corynebacterium caspium DSM 44850]